MKRTFFFCIVLMVMAMQVNAQGVGINADGSTPDTTAILDVQSPTSNQKGILFPRVNLTTGISSPAPHLFVTNLNTAFNAGSRFNSGIGFYRNTGTKAAPDWRRLLESSDSTLFWGTRGNAIVSGDFLGTTNNQNLDIKTGSTPGFAQKLRIPGSNLDPIVVTNVDFFQLIGGNYSSPALRFSASSTSGLYGTSSTLGLKVSSGTLYISGGRARFSTGSEQVADANMKLHIDGNIYTTEKFVYSQYHNATIISNQAKTGKIERYWSGTFPVSPVVPNASIDFFTEGVAGIDNIALRLVKEGDSLNLQARVMHPTTSRNYVSNGIVYTLPFGEWGPWTNISPKFNNTQPTQVFMISRNVPTGGNDLFPTYRVTIFFNGNNENVRVIVEAWYHL